MNFRPQWGRFTAAPGSPLVTVLEGANVYIFVIVKKSERKSANEEQKFSKLLYSKWA